MNIFISTYSDKKNLYKCKLNKKGEISIVKEIQTEEYVSYLHRRNSEIAVALKKSKNSNRAGIAVYNSDLKCIYKYDNESSYTHIFMNRKYMIAGSYHNGNILIINNKNKEHIVIPYNSSKIHNVGKFIKKLYYAVDIENSKIYLYTINNTKYELKNTINLNKLDKPRHLLVYKNHIYILCENTSRIINMEYKNNTVHIKQELTTLNKNENIINMASAIRRDKRYIFVSNRGENTITIYKINKYGYLKKVNYFDVKGKTPRDFNVVKNGKYIIIGNEDTNEVVTFKMNYNKSIISYINKVTIEKPVCIEK